jgi:N-acetyl-gamma-glutamyl-phosphate reductase
VLKVSVVGATGYAGEELIRILLGHPGCKIDYICAKVEKPQRFSEIFPWAKGRLDLVCANLDLNRLKNNKDVDAVFLALPHKTSMEIAPALLKANKTVIDLSADYRLSDIVEYEIWYGLIHKDTENLKKAVYGLPELNRSKIKKAALIANPGCYPTGVILALAPILKKKWIKLNSIIIDSKSGTSGAGRNPSLGLHFCEVNENFKAYKVNQHQHMPEINQELSKIAGEKVNVVFVPYLLPLSRGILSTIYVEVHPSAKIQNLKITKLYKDFYKGEPFVRIKDETGLPQLKDVVGTNFCDIGIKATSDRLIIVSAIDNLVKGAAGQAVQNMNIIFGFKETEGLI